MKQFEMYELTIKGEGPQGSQALVDVTAEFTCDGQTTKVKAFMPGMETTRCAFTQVWQALIPIV